MTLDARDGAAWAGPAALTEYDALVAELEAARECVTLVREAVAVSRADAALRRVAS